MRPVCAPGGAPTFFLRKKKVGKEIAPRCLRPSASLRATCDARSWGGVAELAAFFELRSNIRDEPDHEVRVSCGTRTHPRPCASRRSQKGWERGQTRLLLRSYAGCRFALRAADGRRSRLGEPSAAKDHRPSEAMARMEPAPTPLLTVPRSAGPGVSACRRTRASLSNLPQLFERSSKNAASSAAHPRTEHRRLPPRPWARGTRAAGSPFFGVPFFGDSKKGTSAVGPRPGSRPPNNIRKQTPLQVIPTAIQ